MLIQKLKRLPLIVSSIVHVQRKSFSTEQPFCDSALMFANCLVLLFQHFLKYLLHSTRKLDKEEYIIAIKPHKMKATIMLSGPFTIECL